jgi:hypothetical protein
LRRSLTHQSQPQRQRRLCSFLESPFSQNWSCRFGHFSDPEISAATPGGERPGRGGSTDSDCELGCVSKLVCCLRPFAEQTRVQSQLFYHWSHFRSNLGSSLHQKYLRRSVEMVRRPGEVTGSSLRLQKMLNCMSNLCPGVVDVLFDRWHRLNRFWIKVAYLLSQIRTQHFDLFVCHNLLDEILSGDVTVD